MITPRTMNHVNTVFPLRHPYETINDNPVKRRSGLASGELKPDNTFVLNMRIRISFVRASHSLRTERKVSTKGP